MPVKVTGVSFDDAHSYNDWGLKLKSVSIGVPKAKTVYVSVNGMNGSLDLTEAQNGGVVYEMRTLKFTFDARDCSYIRWTGLISRIARAIEGKERRIILDVTSSNEPWKWDTFSFIDGVIRNTSDIDINSPTSWKEITLDGYPYNDTLKIISNASMKVKYRNGTYDIYAGENIMYDIELYEGENKLYFQGKGKITIVHRGGML